MLSKPGNDSLTLADGLPDDEPLRAEHIQGLGRFADLVLSVAVAVPAVLNGWCCVDYDWPLVALVELHDFGHLDHLLGGFLDLRSSHVSLQLRLALWSLSSWEHLVGAWADPLHTHLSPEQPFKNILLVLFCSMEML